MKRIEIIQSYGRRILYPSASPLIEALPVGKLHVSDTLVFFDAFWPLEDQLLDYAPKVRLAGIDLDVVLSTVVGPDHPKSTSPPRRLVAGVTLVVNGLAPEVWKPLLDGEGPSLISVDNGSIVLFDLADLDNLRIERERADGRELYARVRQGPVERIGSALAISCGMGDGAYEIWLGYGPRGQLVQIVIDLELFDDGEIE